MQVKDHPIILAFEKYNQFGQSNGMKLTIKGVGDISYSMKVKDFHLSTPNHCHGGAIAGLMDSVLGVAALTVAATTDSLCATVEFKLNFLNPVNLGDELIATSKLDYQGKSLVVTSAEIFNQTKKQLVAKGLGTFNLYPATKVDFIHDKSK